MKTMGLNRLYLVTPSSFPCAEATARASGADDVLASARIVPQLLQALHGCRLVFGASARRRRVEWPELDPRACAWRARQETLEGEVAVVFGRESSGLSNDELDRCNFLVRIPSNPKCNSLNLAAAVQILCYELHLAHEGAIASTLPSSPPGRNLATIEEMEGFYRHLEHTLTDLRFLNPDHPRKLMRQLRRLFNRARPDRVELNILRGILSAAKRGSSPRRLVRR